MKTFIGIVIWLGSAAVCTVLFKTGRMSAFTTLQTISTVWLVAGLWINDWFNPEHRALRRRPIGEVFQLAKVGALPKQSPIGMVMSIGGLILSVVGFFVFL
jgi:hypothetical protein